MGDSLNLGGKFELKVYKDQAAFERGEVLHQSVSKNIITNAALAAISGLVGNTGSQTAFTYLELGTGATAPAASQTTLVTPITDSGMARAAATVSRSTTTQTNDTLSLAYSWTASGSKTITEAGIFNAASSGVMLARALTTSYAAVSGNVVTLTYTVKFVGN